MDGEWSAPVYLNSSGFDPSLFHDDDGRKWLVNMIWDGRYLHNRFGGIYLQEYNPEKGALVGEMTNIFRGTPLGIDVRKVMETDPVQAVYGLLKLPADTDTLVHELRGEVLHGEVQSDEVAGEDDCDT